MQSLVLSIMDDKKAPFSSVYVRLPMFLLQKFMDEVREAGMKYEEMEEILGTSVGALKASYHLAVKKIETYINNLRV